MNCRIAGHHEPAFYMDWDVEMTRLEQTMNEISADMTHRSIEFDDMPWAEIGDLLLAGRLESKPQEKEFSRSELAALRLLKDTLDQDIEQRAKDAIQREARTTYQWDRDE